MLGAAQFVLDFQGMHFNAKKALYINFQKNASFFCEAMLSTINGGGNLRCYVLPTSVCATTNNNVPMEDRHSGLIFQHSLANILYVSQRFIKLIQQPKKPHLLVGHFPNRQK